MRSAPTTNSDVSLTPGACAQRQSLTSIVGLAHEFARMGADSVYFYYGVRRTISQNDQEQVGQLEDESHPIFNLAFDHKLHVAWGCLTDGADYFLLIGNEIGRFGIEGIHQQSIPEPRFAEIVEKTKVRLKEAGIGEPPAFYVQLQAQY